MESPRLRNHIDESFMSIHISHYKDIMPKVSDEFHRLLVEGAMNRIDNDQNDLLHRSHLLSPTHYGPKDCYGLREVADYSLPQPQSHSLRLPHKTPPPGDVVPLGVHPLLHSLDALAFAVPNNSRPLRVKVEEGHRAAKVNSDGTTRHLQPWSVPHEEAKSVTVGKRVGSTHLGPASPALIPLRTPELNASRRRHPALIDEAAQSPFLKALSERMKNEMAEFALGEASQPEIVQLDLEASGSSHDHRENVSTRLGMLLARINVENGKAEHDTAWKERVIDAALLQSLTQQPVEEPPRKFIPFSPPPSLGWKLHGNGKDMLTTERALRQDTLAEYAVDKGVAGEIGSMEARLAELGN